MAVAIGVLALGAIVLADTREDAWRQADRASINLVTTIERDIARNIMLYDLSLQGAIDALEQPGIDDVSPSLRQAAIFDRAASAEYLGSILVLDDKGDVRFDSTAIVPHKLHLGDRDYFKVHVDNPNVGMFLSRPFRSRLRNDDASISISRRLSGPDGKFLGVVVGTLRLAYFDDMLHSLDLGRNGSAFLVRDDGHMVARFPEPMPVLDLDMSMADTVRVMVTAPSGTFVASSKIDGIERMYTFRKIDGLPLRIAVGVSTSELLSIWWRKAVVIASALLLLSGATVMLCLFFRREVTRRVRTEAMLTEAASKLSIAASTDDLTGLANRRAFQAEFESAWHRAVRTGSSVALLIADADNFKLYNDRYGHQAGDRVLQSVATCLREQARRPGDLAARHGGEEFATLLPDIGLDGALQVAEQSRQRVAELCIPHADSPDGRVTVSIGVAVTWPQPGDTDSRLVRLADAALYAAKRSGRNRVCVAGASEHALARTSEQEGVTLAAD